MVTGMAGRFHNQGPSQPGSMRLLIILALPGVALLSALTAWAASLIIPACGLDFGPLGRLDRCPAPAARSIELDTEIERQAVLTDRLNVLQRQLAMLSDCPLQPPARQAPPQEPPPDPDSLDAGKWQQSDVTLLDGCWSLASDLSFEDIDTGALNVAVSWEMCFDSQGRGDQEIVMSDGATCGGQVTARFLEDGRLRIEDQGDVHCSDEFYIFRRTITCELEPGGEAACRSVQPEIDDDISDVRIVRRTSP